MKNKNTKKIYQTKKRRAKQALNKALVIIGAIAISCAVINYSEQKIEAGELSRIIIPAVINAEAEELSIRDYVRAEIEKAGLDWEKVNKLIDCESKWNPEAHAVNWNNRKGVDRGLWQISSLYYKHIPNSCAYCYKCSTQEAIKILQKRGYKEWTCGKIHNL